VTLTCKCGGRFRRSNFWIIKSPRVPGGFLYVDRDPLVAHWRCDRCGEERAQRKRLSKEKKGA
jgi:hypothetical protein